MPPRLVTHMLTALLLVGSWCACGPLQAWGQAADSTQMRIFRLAESYLQAGQYEKAIPLLEDLHAARPEAHVFYDRLKQAYESVKRYDAALALVEQRIARQQKTPALLAEKARLRYQKGDGEGARATWQKALALAPDRESTYRVVSQSMLDARLLTDAIHVMQEARQALSKPALFRMNLAYLYSLTGQHAKAVGEYVHFLEESEGRLDFVQHRLAPFLDQPGALKESLAAIESVIAHAPKKAAYRTLAAWLYLEARRYDEALNAYRAVDRLTERHGQGLLTFAQSAADAEAFTAAAAAYEEILNRHASTPVAPKALRALGQMQVRWAETLAASPAKATKESSTEHYEAALSAYQTFLTTYPEHAAYPDVLRRVGRLQLNVLRRLDAAEATLREVVRRYPETRAADEAQLDLGRLALLQGKLDHARQTFTALLERLDAGNLAAQVRYELALLHFYRGAFEDALAVADDVTQHLSTDTANDAIALATLIRSNQGPDSTNTPLARYARARLLHRRHLFAAARDTLGQLLADYGRHALADEARFLRAEILRAQDRPETALQAFGEIPLMYPKSPLADRSLFAIARLQEQQGNLKAAVQAYNRLLEQYPGSLLAGDARERLQALWQDGDR